MAKRIQPPESRAMNHSPNTDGHGAEDARLRLRALRVTRMEAGCCHRPMRLELEAEGLPEAVAAMQDFANASWLNDLTLPFLTCLLNLQDEKGVGVSLREEGWACLEGDGQWVRVSDSYGDERCALVAWEEFEAVMRLKHRFLCLVRDYAAQGVVRYSVGKGLRVRLHASGHNPAISNFSAVTSRQ